MNASLVHIILWEKKPQKKRFFREALVSYLFLSIGIGGQQ